MKTIFHQSLTTYTCVGSIENNISPIAHNLYVCWV